MTGSFSVVVAGGGTAGHIEPALAVGEILRDDYGATVTALGTTKGLDCDLIPARGFDLRLIDPVPVPRKVNAKLFALPANVRRAVHQTRTILTDVQADVLIGFGGYVSAPAYLAARQEHLPFFVHEANARAGLANKLGVRLGGIGLTAVAGSGLKGEVVGVPISRRLTAQLAPDTVAATRAEAVEMWGLDPSRRTVLITGGSQGAASLNRALAGAVQRIVEAGFQVLHAYGPKNEAPQTFPGYVAVPYIDRMAAAYSLANLVVCRAGAMTVAEVTAAGIPAIYVPLPHGNGEQELNARSVIDAGGASLIHDDALTADELATQVIGVLSDEQILDSMRAQTRSNSLGHAAEEIARRVAARVGV
ncbi:MAG: UDP-N-acetylglucosamine--N-acetylmuramyl-(pentapeptide) pyrophosphoryl-undecaprenol N-acetylglucosamine transferase [Corynebacterium sp.]|nr:UDP-N-acetylglucosamine--N-acetylmuramyl-(pentapeptide) pyrophosphoryl-undecaprenol N-acetylglucosamine transferase [Corynebacterium sp.]